MSRRYEELRRNFRIEVPEDFNFGFDIIDQLALERRNRLAMIWAGDSAERAITFRDLSNDSNRIANILRRLGIGKGDRVLLMLPRIPEWWLSMIGVMKRGAVSIPSPISLPSHEIRHRCKKARVKAVITTSANAEQLDTIRSAIPEVEHFILADGGRDGWLDLRAEMRASSRILTHFGFDEMTRASDPMLIYFTPGAADDSRIVTHPHSYALAHRATAELWHDLKPNDIHWSITDPTAPESGCGAFLGAWIIGATLFVHDDNDELAPRDILRLLERYGITTFCASPSIYRMVTREDVKRHDLSDLRHCTSAGGPLDPQVVQLWKDGTEGLEIHEGYGDTETVTIVATLPGMKIKRGSMGKPLPPYEVEVLRDDLTPAAVGEKGMIAVKVFPGHPPGIFDGYEDADEINSRVFAGDWYLTGYRGYRDEEGYFWMVGG